MYVLLMGALACLTNVISYSQNSCSGIPCPNLHSFGIDMTRTTGNEETTAKCTEKLRLGGTWALMETHHLPGSSPALENVCY